MSLESVQESSDCLLGSQATSAGSETDNNSKPVPAKEAISEDEGLKGAQFEPIAMPASYNPLEQLERFEALEKFKNQFGPKSDASRGGDEIRVSLN